VPSNGRTDGLSGCLLREMTPKRGSACARRLNSRQIAEAVASGPAGRLKALQSAYLAGPKPPSTRSAVVGMARLPAKGS
jgi:hypothetical protein